MYCLKPLGIVKQISRYLKKPISSIYKYFLQCSMYTIFIKHPVLNKLMSILRSLAKIKTEH